MLTDALREDATAVHTRDSLGLRRPFGNRWNHLGSRAFTEFNNPRSPNMKKTVLAAFAVAAAVFSTPSSAAPISAAPVEAGLVSHVEQASSASMRRQRTHMNHVMNHRRARARVMMHRRMYRSHVREVRHERHMRQTMRKRMTHYHHMMNRRARIERRHWR